MAIFCKFCFVILVHLLSATSTSPAPVPAPAPSPTSPSSKSVPTPDLISPKIAARTPNSPAPILSPLPISSIDSTESKKGSYGKLSGIQKAGIVLGVFAGAGVLVCCCLVYKKRHSNIRRGRHGFASRRPAP
ncbi:hypothetical protein SLEP1_g42542 [Rubroshorea leprosula]|uniref:Transmembrane protein n=1 Tax=Rubroshorea leprosula TaxID=152421 RepID=A0AAV5LA45_9ROSI|nr:hypothetical protein SLEP1_g42542 [Rubroshorea leprosula]